MYAFTSAATFFTLSSSLNIEEANSKVRGPPFVFSVKSGFVKDLITDKGPLIFANKLAEKLVPNGSPFLLPSGDAPISFACHK